MKFTFTMSALPLQLNHHNWSRLLRRSGRVDTVDTMS